MTAQLLSIWRVVFACTLVYFLQRFTSTFMISCHQRTGSCLQSVNPAVIVYWGSASMCLFKFTFELAVNDVSRGQTAACYGGPLGPFQLHAANVKFLHFSLQISPFTSPTQKFHISPLQISPLKCHNTITRFSNTHPHGGPCSNGCSVVLFQSFAHNPATAASTPYRCPTVCPRLAYGNCFATRAFH